jgi:hypothetical protein
MLIGVTYNCDPDSIGQVPQTTFAEAFENVVRVRPLYRNLRIAVTFTPGRSWLTAIDYDEFSFDTDLERDAGIQEEFGGFAEKAFGACLDDAAGGP